MLLFSILAISLSIILVSALENAVCAYLLEHCEGACDWKLARVVPIFKSGNRSDMNNYRPISIISSAAKIFEKIVCDQFYEYLSFNDLISHHQSGFRPTYSTTTALLDSTNDWCVNIDNGLVNGVIFIDLKKAFDTVETLLKKLECYGVDSSALDWFSSYLSDRTQKCFVNGALSSSGSYSYSMVFRRGLYRIFVLH